MESTAFETEFHVDLAKQLPLLKDALFRGEVEATADEGEIHAGEWDSDAFSSSFIVPQTVMGWLGKVRKSDYGLQTASNTHFDLSNFRGSTEVARKRYENALAYFLNDESISETKNAGGYANNDLTGRGFQGKYAGVKNLLYRFGQNLHSYQDFYSHSNWVEMSKVDGGKWGLKDKLFDSSFGLPRILDQGDFIPGTKVMIVLEPNGNRPIKNAEGVDLGTFKVQGKGSFGGANINPFASKTPVFWQVASTGENGRQMYEMYTITTTGEIVGGIASGAVDPLIYKDPDLSVKMRDSTKTGFLEKEFFRGFGHGGIAGNGGGQRVGDLNKDKASNPLHQEAMDFAAKQSRHEFDRLSYLIYERYGRDGLQRFADYAIKPEKVTEYVDFYAKSAPSKYVSPSSSLLSGLPSSQAIEADLGAVESARLDTDAERRRLFVFDNSEISSSNPYYFVDQAKIGLEGSWYDLASPQGLHGDFDLEPAPVNHLDLGLRGYWSQNSSGQPGDLGNDFFADDALSYYVEDLNRDKVVVLSDFVVGKDSLFIVNPLTGAKREIEEITHSNYADMEKTLLSDFNIVLDALPFVEVPQPSVVIRSNEVDGLESGQIVIRADQFYGDYDDVASWGSTGDDDALRFTDYDQSFSWLRLDEASGNLIVDVTDSLFPASGSYDVVVRVSDENSSLDEQRIKIEIDPSLSVGKDFKIKTDTPFRVNLRSSELSAYQVFYRIEESGYGEELMYPLFSSLGAASGLPMNVNYLANLKFSDAAHSGELVFYGRNLSDGSVEQLSASNSFGSSIVLSNGVGELFELEFADGSWPSGDGHASGFNKVLNPALPVGYSLASASSGISESAAGLQVFDLSYTVTSEADQNFEVGFLLMDSLTGAIYDPAKREFIDHHSDFNDFLDMDGGLDEALFLDAVNLHQQSVIADSTVSESFRFDHALPMLSDRLEVVPFVRYQSGEYASVSQLFDGNEGLPSGLVLGANAVGFEDTFGPSSDADYDDVVLIIDALDRVV